MAPVRPAAIVAAILLPPLGIFLGRGLGPSFWIAVGLTCLGFIPGVAYALFTLLRGVPAGQQTSTAASIRTEA